MKTPELRREVLKRLQNVNPGLRGKVKKLVRTLYDAAHVDNCVESIADEYLYSLRCDRHLHCITKKKCTPWKYFGSEHLNQ